MPKKQIVVDKESIVLYLGMTHDDKVFTINPSQIQRISIERCYVFSWFRRVPSERITIVTSQSSPPYVFLKHKHKQYYDEYKTKLTEFAKRHYVTFQDTTVSTE